jgi:hypothetical protein
MAQAPDTTILSARAEAHAAMLETAASLMELDGIGLDPEQGHVQHLRSMAGAIRAQAALGKLAQSYPGARYLPASPISRAAEHNTRSEAPDRIWH